MYTFVPKKSFGELLDISPKNFTEKELSIQNLHILQFGLKIRILNHLSYSVYSRGRILVEDYGFLSFAVNMSKRISKTLCKKYSQKPFDHAKKSSAVAIRTASKKYFKKHQQKWVI